MVIFSVIFIATLSFLFFFNSFKLYRNFKLVRLAAKGFIEAVKKLRDWQEKNPYASEFDPKLQDLKLASVGAYMILLIALGFNDDYSLRHLDEYERKSFLEGEG